ncbi:MAG: hypothetical protein ABIR61_09425 [Casimicrobiaceae bacterium]
MVAQPPDRAPTGGPAATGTPSGIVSGMRQCGGSQAFAPARNARSTRLVRRFVSASAPRVIAERLACSAVAPGAPSPNSAEAFDPNRVLFESRAMRELP